MLDDPFADREPDPGAGVLLPRVEPLEGLEDPGLFPRRDADAMVSHHEAQPLSVRLGPERHSGRDRPVELEGVPQKVRAPLDELTFVAYHLGKGFQPDLRARLLHAGAQVLERALRHPIHRDPLEGRPPDRCESWRGDPRRAAAGAGPPRSRTRGTPPRPRRRPSHTGPGAAECSSRASVTVPGGRARRRRRSAPALGWSARAWPPSRRGLAPAGPAQRRPARRPRVSRPPGREGPARGRSIRGDRSGRSEEVQTRGRRLGGSAGRRPPQGPATVGRARTIDDQPGPERVAGGGARPGV